MSTYNPHSQLLTRRSSLFVALLCALLRLPRAV